MKYQKTLRAAAILQLWAFIVLAVWTTPTAAQAAGRFLDDDGSVHEAAIEAIAAAGITEGCDPSGNRFCPNAPLTRGQMAAFLDRALGLSASGANSFGDDNGSIFEGAINRLAAAGIAKGCAIDRFCPSASVTRGEMAVFLTRAFSLGPARGDLFQDDEASPYEDQINSLASAKLSNGCGSTRFCPDSNVARGEVASFLARGLGLTVLSSSGCQGVQVAAGSNLTTVASAHPAGTTFCLAAGSYSVGSTIPTQSGDRWLGDNVRSILSGGDSTATAFHADGVSNVIVRGLVIERFNTPVGGGLAALKTGSGWIVENNEIRNNATVGIYHESRTQIRGNFIHHNGQYGIAGFKTVDGVVENNEVSFNNTRGTEGGIPSADRGGAKWVGTTNLVVRNNYFHDNFHAGIWIDADNVGSLVEGNRVTNNTGHGIHFEISCSGTIRGNTVSGNGATGIFVNASQNAEVANNVVSNNGKGIVVWAQDRGGGTCDWNARNVSVHDNAVTMQNGYSGLERCCGEPSSVFSSGTVRFANNTYTVSNTGGRWLQWSDGLRTWTEWQTYGQDVGGVIR